MDNSQNTCIICSSVTQFVGNVDLPICRPCLQRQASGLQTYQDTLEELYKIDPSKLQYVSEMDEIIPHKLYLGNYEAASNMDLLMKNGITHILVCGEFLKINFPDKFTYLQLPLADSLKQGLLEYLAESYQFIENGQTVFVHCAAGINRSVAITCAYLMKKNNWQYEQAFTYVKERRPKANKQTNFAAQLQNYEY